MLAIATAPAERQLPLVRSGEEIVYTVHSSRFGNIGKAVMRVDLDTVQGVSAYRLSFDFSARIALFNVSDQTRSWLDAGTLTTLRYAKHEKSPLGGRHEDVTVGSDAASDLPLDELSFIYFIRALDLSPGESVVVHRHFDQRRNPVRVKALAASYYEMTVPDARQAKGSSTLRFLISTDGERLPLRIESVMPVGGKITMTMQSHR